MNFSQTHEFPGKLETPCKQGCPEEEQYKSSTDPSSARSFGHRDIFVQKGMALAQKAQ